MATKPSDPPKPNIPADLITTHIALSDVPDYVRWLHKCATEGSANRYGNGVAGFVIHDTDAIVQPLLEPYVSIILHYTPKEKVVVM